MAEREISHEGETTVAPSERRASASGWDGRGKSMVPVTASFAAK